MNDVNDLDPRKVTFSQAYGYEELPQPLKLEELSKQARTQLWSLLYDQVETTLIPYKRLGVPWRMILKSVHQDILNLPTDEFFPEDLFEAELEKFVATYKTIFMNAPFFKVFNILQAIMRHSDCPPEFTQSVSQIFKRCRLAYVVDSSNSATIYPAATEEEGKAILQATAELNSAGLASAVAHLRKASDCINQGDYPGAVRESIHAVESAARQYDPNAKTLEPALKALEKAGTLHSALKQAFSKLYGYTSDEQGIRHALINKQQSNAGQDEAVFMIGACASFSGYLARKLRHLTP